jgi:hypothetical protein
MGTWGVGSFENDDALDWVAGLVDSDGPEEITEAFAPLLATGGGYLEATDCSIGLAAAEVVAALNGRPGGDLPDEAKEWAGERLGAASRELVSNARQVIAAVTMSSELKELWEESDDYAAWQERVADLSRRLA